MASLDDSDRRFLLPGREFFHFDWGSPDADGALYFEDKDLAYG
jgi:hypothetical protein